MDLEQLEHFLAVSETQNFTRAAELISLSQPAISRSIQRLEEEFALPLFERQSRKVTLTEAGEMFLPRARQVLALINEAKLEINDDGQSGRLRIGAIPTIAPYFLPGLLQEFSQHYPQATLWVHEDTTDNLLGRLKQGEIDVAILALPIPAKYLEVEELFSEELFVVLAHDHPLSVKKQLYVADVRALPFVLLAEAHCLSENILGFCSQRAFQPISLEKTSQLATVLELVAINHGISLIPQMAQRQDDSPLRIYRSMSGAKPTRTIAAAWNSYRFQSRLLKAFHASLREYSRAFACKPTPQSPRRPTRKAGRP